VFFCVFFACFVRILLGVGFVFFYCVFFAYFVGGRFCVFLRIFVRVLCDFCACFCAIFVGCASSARDDVARERTAAVVRRVPSTTTENHALGCRVFLFFRDFFTGFRTTCARFRTRRRRPRTWWSSLSREKRTAFLRHTRHDDAHSRVIARLMDDDERRRCRARARARAKRRCWCLIGAAQAVG